MSNTLRTLQEFRTTLAPTEVLDRARTFFAQRHGIYSAYLEQLGPTHATFRGQGGEEVVLGVATVDGATRVTGSTYLFDMQIARFFSTLPPASGLGVATDLAPVAEVQG